MFTNILFYSTNLAITFELLGFLFYANTKKVPQKRHYSESKICWLLFYSTFYKVQCKKSCSIMQIRNLKFVS